MRRKFKISEMDKYFVLDVYSFSLQEKKNKNGVNQASKAMFCWVNWTRLMRFILK